MEYYIYENEEWTEAKSFFEKNKIPMVLGEIHEDYRPYSKEINGVEDDRDSFEIFKHKVNGGCLVIANTTFGHAYIFLPDFISYMNFKKNYLDSLYVRKLSFILEENMNIRKSIKKIFRFA